MLLGVAVKAVPDNLLPLYVLGTCEHLGFPKQCVFLCFFLSAKQERQLGNRDILACSCRWIGWRVEKHFFFLLSPSLPLALALALPLSLFLSLSFFLPLPLPLFLSPPPSPSLSFSPSLPPSPPSLPPSPSLSLSLSLSLSRSLALSRCLSLSLCTNDRYIVI